MRKHISLLLLSAFLFAAAPLRAGDNRHQAEINDLNQRLSGARTPADSVKILYDIFDLSQRSDYPELAKSLFGCAKRAGDTATQLDVCRQVTAALKDDDDYAKLEEAVAALPASDEQKETLLFVKMKRVSIKSRKLPEEERQKEIAAIAAGYDEKNDYDKYDHILDLFTLVEYLRNEVSGDMLKQYLDALYKEATSSDFSLYAIPNIVYAETANSYTMAADRQKAMEADRQLLDVIAGLEKKYARQGRKYRNYNVSKYVCYRRMLRNHEALEPGEAESLFQKIQTLAASSYDVEQDLTTNPHTLAFYYMATGRYAEAIPYLVKLKENDETLTTKKRALELLVKAAEETGNDAMRLQALQEYNDILEQYNQMSVAEQYRELQIKYDIKSLKERNALLELQAKQNEVESTRRLMAFVLAAFVIIAVALVLTLVYWSRYRRNSYQLGHIANRLSHERDRLRLSVFHDSEDDPLDDDSFTFHDWCMQRKKLFRRNYNIATFMVQSIVNDLMQIAFLGKENRLRHICPVSVDAVMRKAKNRADEMSGSAKRISVKYPEDDYNIVSDSECLSHVIGQILYGMASHADPDSIVSLECEKLSGNGVRFLFTSPHDHSLTEDTEAYKPIVSAEEMSDGYSTGIFVDRIISLLLMSDIKEDKAYTQGTRFMFTTPADLRQSGSHNINSHINSNKETVNAEHCEA